MTPDYEVAPRCVPRAAPYLPAPVVIGSAVVRGTSRCFC